MDSESSITEMEQVARSLVDGKKVVVYGMYRSYARELSRELLKCGATDVLLISRGAEDSANPFQVSDHVVEMQIAVHDDDFLGGKIASNRANSLPTAIVKELDEFDPNRESLVLGDCHLTVSTVAGRKALGGREEKFEQWEDKTQIDDIFDSLNIRRPNAKIVPAEREAMIKAAREIGGDNRLTVWSADSSRGITSGGLGVRVVEPDSIEIAADLFSQYKEVRIAQFHFGTPLCIHGIVTPDRVVLLRPTEQCIVLTDDDDLPKLEWVGYSTKYRLPDGISEPYIAGYKMGNALRREGYRGWFALDGVFDWNSFYCIEVNTRIGGSVRRALNKAIETPPELLTAAIQSGNCDGRTLAELAGPLQRSIDKSNAVEFVLTVETSQPDQAFRPFLVTFPANEGALTILPIDEDREFLEQFHPSVVVDSEGIGYVGVFDGVARAQFAIANQSNWANGEAMTATFNDACNQMLEAVGCSSWLTEPICEKSQHTRAYEDRLYGDEDGGLISRVAERAVLGLINE